MRCPVCRAGDDNAMTASSVPIHLSKAVVSHAAFCRKQEAAEQAREDHNESVATIQRILSSNLIQAYVPFADSNFPSTVKDVYSLMVIHSSLTPSIACHGKLLGHRTPQEGHMSLTNP
eukprot:1683920-Rhodomonas_salina.1